MIKELHNPTIRGTFNNACTITLILHTQS